MALDSTVMVLEQYGPVAPTVQAAPIHFPEVRTTDGLGVEEATTNLVTNPSFEVDTTGWSAGAATIARSIVRAFVGPASLLVTPTTTGAGSGLVSTNTTIVVGTTYTISAWVFVPAGSSPVRLQVSGNFVTVTGSPSTVTGQWQRISVTAAGASSGATGTVTVQTVNATTATQPVWVDAVQVEAKAYATSYCDGSMGTGYAWTGASNASTSTRALADLRHNFPTTPASTVTLCAWMRRGHAAAQANADTISVGSLTERFTLGHAGNTLSAQKVIASTPVSVTPSLTTAPGDLVFQALTFDGTTLIGYAAKNGGPVVSASAASATVPAPLVTATPGATFGLSTLNGSVEQALLYSATLTPAEIASLAFDGPRDYVDDSRIVYAAATRRTRGTLNALTSAGSGLFRASRTLAANLDVLADFSPAAYAFGTGATHRISVPAGSGVGEGQALGFTTDGARYTVVKAYSPGGIPDELYVQQVA